MQINDDDLQDASDLYHELCDRIDQEEINLACAFVSIAGVLRYISEKCEITPLETINYFSQIMGVWDAEG